MKFSCILFKRDFFLNLAYLLIFITLLFMWVVHIIDYPSSLFLLITFCSFILLLVLKFIVEKKLKVGVFFHILGNSFYVSEESEIIEDESRNQFKFSAIKKYRITIVGDLKYYELKFYLHDGSKNKYTFVKNSESSTALESFNIKILDYNKIDSNIEKIELAQNFVTTEKGLWLLRFSIAVLFFTITRLIIYQSKSSLAPTLILFSGVIQMYTTRKSQKILEEKLLNGEPLT